jgi:hypothetical protein
MSGKERRRLEMLSQVRDGKLSVARAGRLLGLSERQVRRLWKRYGQEGAAGLVHGLRGRGSNAAKADLRAEAVAGYRCGFQGLGAAHAADLLGGAGLRVPRQTLWRWLRQEGLLARTRRVGRHRIRRPRRPSVGELVQMDGSTHRWLGEAAPACVLFVMIDDASSRVLARFYASEDTAAAFDLFGRYARAHGLPLALYVDKDSIYQVNDAQAQEACRQAGKKPPVTQFGRAMAALGVQIIPAGSPQAKGRVERVNRTLQDRLVKELALAGITDLAAANAYLGGGFLERLHALIGVQPAASADLHRPLDRRVKLGEVLCLQEERVVGADWCVRYQNRFLQIDRRHASAALAGRSVQVLELADGTLKLKRQDRELTFAELAQAPAPVRPARRTLGARTPWRPGPEHPWKQGPAVRAARAARGAVKPAPLQAGSLRSPSFRSAGLTASPSAVTLLLRR